LFLKGLRENGVPMKYSSWHTFIFSSSQAQNVNLLVQERSRSVKAIFAVQKRPTSSYGFDSGASFFDTSFHASTLAGTLQTFQFRIGGRFVFISNKVSSHLLLSKLLQLGLLHLTAALKHMWN
jgi:hypothetical protein